MSSQACENYSRAKSSERTLVAAFSATCSTISSSNFSINVSCTFNVLYYANNGSWSCNVTATDSNSTYGSENLSSTVNGLVAIELSSQLIDYGGVESGQNSSQFPFINMTNVGNLNLNISVTGFARSSGDNLSMNCSQGNISIDRERYSFLNNSVYLNMTMLTNNSVTVQNLTVLQRVNDAAITNDRNVTYWGIGLPVGLKGNCSGFVSFTGSAS